ncbi:MAG: tetratricopeptide repeat protein [Desulfovibrionaceae bacterium]|nr:tetratricopeptide repeat protein [Desulfovibrionaceae bacterium]
MSGKEDTGAKAAQVKRSGEEKIRGVFSTQSVARVGTGTTQRKTIQKTFWFVEEKKAGVVSVQPLNKNYVPSGPKREVPKEDFLAKFSPEPEFYLSTVYPKMRELNETISRGEQARERGALYSAEFEFKNAAKVDDDNVKANFGLGLTYLERGETVKANDIFKRLVNLEASFDKEHKHLFNDFGINLRKNKMLEQALDYYLRAEKLVENDENLYHNIARAYYEKGDIEKCVQYLDKCLRLKPDMEEAVKFMEYLKKNGYVKDGEVRPEASGGSRGASGPAEGQKKKIVL